VAHSKKLCLALLTMQEGKWNDPVNEYKAQSVIIPLSA
jgi:hypothetical protein